MSDEAEVTPQSLFVPIGQVAEATAAAAVADSAAEEADGQAGPRVIQGPAAGDVMALKSLCVACEDEGITRLLLTRIPFFRDVILMAFECEHCGYRNSEVQSAEVQERGCRFEVKVSTTEDMNRQLVKSDRATVTIPELDFEVPPITQKGVFTTIEGFLDRALENLNNSQTIRRSVDPEGADKVDAFIARLQAVRDGAAFPFTLILDDPSGNSFLENPHAPRADPALKVRYYSRTLEQNHALGCYAESARMGMIEEGEEGDEEKEDGGAAGGGAGSDAPLGDEDGDVSTLVGSGATTIFPEKRFDSSGNQPSRFRKGGALIQATTGRAVLTERHRRAGVVRGADGSMGLIFDSSSTDAMKEVMRFPVDCFNCSTTGECRMCVTDVPHFKEVILMSFLCDECGWRNVEVKGGGAVPAKGTTTILRYDPTLPDADQDMTRDVIKGDTASLEIPELDMLLEQGSLGGMYTTVEGLLTAARDKLMESDAFLNDATDGAKAGGGAARKTAFSEFMDRLEAVIAGRVPFTLKLQDPMANSWIYSPCAPAPDPRLDHFEYSRSTEEDLELGILDMKTEDYGEDKDVPDEESSSGGGAGGAAAATETPAAQ